MLQAFVDLSDFTPVWAFYESMIPHCVERIAEEIAVETEDEMKRRAPVGKTRRLAENIRRIRLGPATWAVAPINVPYLPYVVYGTRPHTIYPRVAQALRWIDEESGEARFAMYVHHPGTRPNSFIRQTEDVVRSRAPWIAERVFKSMVGG